MKYLDYEVSTGPNSIIEVELSGNAANVLVMGDSDFRRFRSGQPHQYRGGHYTQSPVRIKVPPGAWHVVVHLGGYAGQVSASVRVLG